MSGEIHAKPLIERLETTSPSPGEVRWFARATLRAALKEDRERACHLRKCLGIRRLLEKKPPGGLRPVEIPGLSWIVSHRRSLIRDPQDLNEKSWPKGWPGAVPVGRRHRPLVLPSHEGLPRSELQVAGSGCDDCAASLPRTTNRGTEDLGRPCSALGSRLLEDRDEPPSVPLQAAHVVGRSAARTAPREYLAARPGRLHEVAHY